MVGQVDTSHILWGSGNEGIQVGRKKKKKVLSVIWVSFALDEFCFGNISWKNYHSKHPASW